MRKEYKFPAIPKKCKVCGLKIAGKRVELGAMRGSQPMGKCPECGYAYPLEEVKPPAEPPATNPETSEPGEEPPAEE